MEWMFCLLFHRLYFHSGHVTLIDLLIMTLFMVKTSRNALVTQHTKLAIGSHLPNLPLPKMP